MRRYFQAFVRKEFRHILRDRLTLLVMFGIPIIQVILFGYAITTDVSNADLAVVDRAGTQRSGELIRTLVASGYFKATVALQDRAQIDGVFKAGDAKLALVVPPDFDRDLEAGSVLVQLIADASDPNTASLLVSYAEGIMTNWAAERLSSRTSAGAPLIRIDVRMHYNPELRSVLMFVPGIVTVLLMLVSATLTSISIAREKELGTMEVLLTSPLPPVVIVVGKVLPYLLLSLINASLVLAVGNLVFGVPLNGSPLLLFAEIFLFVLTALSLGVLISTVSASQQVALMISLFALMMPTILLSGFIYPVSSMPLLLRILSHLIPARYFIEILRGIMLKGVGLEALWHQTAVLAAMTLVFIAVSVKRFKIRLE